MYSDFVLTHFLILIIYYVGSNIHLIEYISSSNINENLYKV